jgi:hypothetical protein
MANQQQLQNLGNAIGYIAVTDINGLRNLLSKYGVVNVGSDSKTLITETTNLVSNSRFYNEFVALVQKNLGEASFSGYNNIGGDYGSWQPSSDSLLNSNTLNQKLTDVKSPSNSSGGFFSGINLGSLISTGASIYGSVTADKRQKDLLNAQANQQAQQTQGQILAGQLALEQEKLKLAQIQAQNEKGGGSNTLLYVGLGLVGLIVVGGVIYAVTKK